MPVGCSRSAADFEGESEKEKRERKGKDAERLSSSGHRFTVGIWPRRAHHHHHLTALVDFPLSDALSFTLSYAVPSTCSCPPVSSYAHHIRIYTFGVNM